MPAAASVPQPPSGPPDEPHDVLDVGALTSPDAEDLDALARAQLAARRRGHRLVLRAASPPLRDLLQLAGLCGVLPEEDAARTAEEGSVLEVVGQPEEGEQPGGVEEVRHPGDPAR